MSASPRQGKAAGEPADGETAGRGPRWARSLRFRLLAATLVAVALAMMLSGWGLAGLFRDHVMRQFQAALAIQLDELTARLEFDVAGRPVIDPRVLTDPRWSRPYSGLYWQLDRHESKTPQRGVLRSRSLWDTALQAPADTAEDGTVHVHEVSGPGGSPLLLLERSVRRPEDAGGAWRLLVAGELRETQAAVARFNGVLAASLAMLLVLLGAATVAQVAVGLAPLRALQRALAAVHEGRSQHLAGRFPTEVQPLIDDFNYVLARNAEAVARARTHAGNLAHAIKTPLAAMAQAAAAAEHRPEAIAELPGLVKDQVAAARRHVDWHLARARAAAAQGMPGLSVPLATVVGGLIRALERVHADRGIVIDSSRIDSACAVAGETQDMQEILGNLLDNACKWARREVQVSAARVTEARRPWVRIVIEDDGPGIAATRREEVLARGARLDETVPGSGLGLAIVRELVGLYGGRITLGVSARGGLRVEITLPGHPAERSA